MFPLDPVKLLLVGVVALVVLGPDKLPPAARKLSSLLADLQKLRTSLQSEVHGVVGDLPLVDELTGAKQLLTRVADPRQALYRSVGLGDARDAGDVGDAEPGQAAVPMSVDLAPRDPGPAGVPAGAQRHGPAPAVDLVTGDPSHN